MAYSYVNIPDAIPKPFDERCFESSSSDSTPCGKDLNEDTGFASRTDPDFSKMTPDQLRDWTRKHNYKPEAVTNEVFNTTSHLFGGIVALAGIVILIVQSNSTVKRVSFTLYGLSLLMMLFGSALHHGVGLHWGISIKLYRALRLVDHEGIFFVIAGTLTPFALVVIGGALGITLVIYMYFIMVCGVTMKLVLRHTVNQNIFNFIYLLMGWSCVLIFKPIKQNIGLAPIWYVLGGGLAFTVGIIFFSLEKPNPWPGVFCSHEIWHIFVLIGVGLHYFAHYLYTLKYEPSQ